MRTRLETVLLGLVLACGIAVATDAWAAQGTKQGSDQGTAVLVPANQGGQGDSQQSQQQGQSDQQQNPSDGSDALPTLALTAPAGNTVNLYPAPFAVEATVTFPGKAGERKDQREGVEIEFLADGQKFAEAEHAPYQASYTPQQAGIHTLVARIHYGEGKRIIESAPVTVVSNLPPTVNFTAPANNSVVTAPATFGLAATATAPVGSIAKVEFFNGTTLIGSAAAGTGGSYTYTWNNVPWGNYTITTKATDNYGYSTTTAPITVIANAPPSVSLAAPANNTVSTAPGSFTLSANASDVDGTIAKVEFYATDTKTNTKALLGTATSAPYTYTQNNVPAGIYTLTAVATDNYGASTTSAPVTVISDAPPSVNLTGPAANTVSTAPGSFALTATASSQLGTIARVEFYNGTTLLGSATTAPYSFSWTNVPAGSYSITAKAIDSYGIASTSAAVPVISNAPPSVSLTAPANNAVSTAPGSFTLSANASDVDGTIAKVEFYATDTKTNARALLGTATSAPYSYTQNNVPAGIYSLTAVATDNRGASTTSSSVTVISDAPPSVSLTGPAPNTVSTAPASFTLTATASSQLGSIARVEFYNGTTLLGSATTAPYSFNWANVPAGSYSISAKAIDSYGIASTSTAVPVISNAPPQISFTAPANNAVSTAPGSFTLTANASDTDGTIAKVEFFNGTMLLGSATAGTGGNYSFNWANIPAGIYTLTAVATDNRGATATTTPITLVSDAAPGINLTSPAANTVSNAPGNFALTATASSQLGTIAKVEFFNGSSLIGAATAGTGGSYSYTWANVPAGSYSITAKATDSYGLSASSAAVTITVKSAELVAYYIHPDQLGTPREITDQAGNVVWQWDNADPYGNNVPNENPTGAGQFSFPLRFPGQYADRETNTYYNVNRDYDASTGRYIESDPIGLAGGINAYTYVMNSPVNFSDPLGQDTQIGVGISGTLFGPPTGNMMFGSIGISGGVSVGISTNGTMGGTSVVVQVQANSLAGGGIFAGVGIQGNVGNTNGSMSSSTSTTPYFEANSAMELGSGVSGAVTPSGEISGGGSVQGFPGTGYGAMVAGGVSTSTTWVSPTISEVIGGIKNWIKTTFSSSQCHQ